VAEATGPAEAVEAAPSIVIDEAGAPYRFELRFERKFDANRADLDCDSGPLILTVTSQGGAAPSQELRLDQICVARDWAGQVLVNDATLHDDRGMIETGDFNFDGAPDFAVQNARNSCDGGPSYHVFLFDAKSGRFALNEAFTPLTEDWCGFFQVDPVRQELRTHGKLGCNPMPCWHEYIRWKVVEGVPEQVNRRTVQRVPGEHEGEFDLVEREERLEGGSWMLMPRRIVEE